MIIPRATPSQGLPVIPVAIAVLAKEPAPGRVKTRLCPPYSITEASRLAAAALADTLDAVARAAVAHRLLVLDGEPSEWRRPHFRVLAQRGAGLADRLDNALIDVARITHCPVLVVGMDTPQLRRTQLEHAAATLTISDAVIGPSTDGGFWAIGVREPRAGLCSGVQMSRPDTGEQQCRRLRRLGLSPARLHQLTDVDDVSSAAIVAALAPRTRFAKLVTALAEAA